MPNIRKWNMNILDDANNGDDNDRLPLTAVSLKKEEEEHLIYVLFSI